MSKINLNAVLKFAGYVLLIEAAGNVVSGIVAAGYSENISPFIWSLLITAVAGLLTVWIVSHAPKQELSNKDGYLVIIVSWLVLSLAGTLPYLFSNTADGFVNAFFESVSGFTTTGSTSFGSVEQLPHSVLFWRSLTQWTGGFCVLYMLVSVLPIVQIGGHNLYSSEIPASEKFLVRNWTLASWVVLIYSSLTLIEIISLAAGGMHLFDSICISFGTVSTGGFAVKNDSLASYAPNLQYIVTLFMFLSATNYIVLLYIINRDIRKIRSNGEFSFYLLITGLSVIYVAAVLFARTDRDLSVSVRDSAFQVVSQITTTGFATSNYSTWPVAAYFFMFLLLFAGGCTISTSGGIKMARHLVMYKNLKVLMIKLQHPNSVVHVKLNGKIVPEIISNTVVLFFFLYIILFVLGSVILILTGIPVNEALGGSATALANAGPGLGASGNMGNYSSFGDTAKITMSVLMIAGRVEIFTLFALFTKTFWKR